MTLEPSVLTCDLRPPTSDDVLVRVEGVSKKFCRSLRRSLWYGVNDIGNEMLGRRGSHGELRRGEFWAVDGVSFELRRGECLGLIGRNGAGKTTLLKMLNGLIKPDKGRIEMHGRVGALISLGAGFNPILTGRENIYINGSVLGLSKKEIDAKIEEIIDFAEIRDFIDSPAQSYSSGMAVRLGFAIATALEPDVLLLDEVLAVGDAPFRAKCFKRVGDILSVCAVIFVSHDENQVQRICNRGLLLERGRPYGPLDVAEVLYQYRHSRRVEASQSRLSGLVGDILVDTATVRSVVFDKDMSGQVSPEKISVHIEVDCISSKEIGLALIHVFKGEQPVLHLDVSSQVKQLPQGRHTLDIEFANVGLVDGEYSVSVAFFDLTRKCTVLHLVRAMQFTYSGPLGYGPPVLVDGVVRIR